VRIIIKDLKSLKKEKTFITIMALILFIASFASVITFGLILLYNPDAVGITVSDEINIAFVGNATILEKIVGGKKYESISDALSAFKSGEVDAVVWLPEENVHDVNIVEVFLPKDEIVSIKAALVLKEKMIAYEKILRRSNGIPEDLGIEVLDYNYHRVDVPEDFSSAFKFVYVVLIPILVLTTAAISAGLLIDLITEEIETGTFHVLASTPLKHERFILEKLTTPLIISLCLTFAWLSLLTLNGIVIKNVSAILLISTSVSLILISLSLFLTLFFAERESAQLTFSLFSVGIVALSFTSPFMPSGVIARIAAGSYFTWIEVFGYVLLSVLLLLMAYSYAVRRCMKVI
jgi:ABC-type transport system involved in multi-copper enzyme maturation permease subunit